LEATVSEDLAARARTGEELPVDYSAIEKSLAELWRSEKDGENAIMRAALWNVVAHTINARDHAHASETLAKASESIPQRSIVIRADAEGEPDIASWISANCHLVGDEKQVCSEEVAIVAGGERVRHIPPLMNALLIPDMPVAVWWVGDLPSHHHEYLDTMLEPADRLIVDSSHFDSVSDLIYLRDIAARTTTAAADLNWARLEDWRIATAMIFDPPAMRAKLKTIRRLSITATAGEVGFFGDSVEQLQYAAWLNAQAGAERLTQIDYRFDFEEKGEHPGALARVQIEFADGLKALIVRDNKRNVVSANVDGMTQEVDCVTRVLGKGVAELIVRQLKRPEIDKVFAKALPLAIHLAARLA
jgi:glucose-6-phosphate dehydrogenase assembly protein OpcA